MYIIKPHQKLTSDFEDHFVRVVEDVNSKGRDDSDSFIIERFLYNQVMFGRCRQAHVLISVYQIPGTYTIERR